MPRVAALPPALAAGRAPTSVDAAGAARARVCEGTRAQHRDGGDGYRETRACALSLGVCAMSPGHAVCQPRAADRGIAAGPRGGCVTVFHAAPTRSRVRVLTTAPGFAPGDPARALPPGEQRDDLNPREALQRASHAVAPAPISPP
jgi:hypothetical protein